MKKKEYMKIITGCWRELQQQRLVAAGVLSNSLWLLERTPTTTKHLITIYNLEIISLHSPTNSSLEYPAGAPPYRTGRHAA
jgi:hypothetical protein